MKFGLMSYTSLLCLHPYPPVNKWALYHVSVVLFMLDQRTSCLTSSEFWVTAVLVILKMEAAGFPETLVLIFQTICLHIPWNCNIERMIYLYYRAVNFNVQVFLLPSVHSSKYGDGTFKSVWCSYYILFSSLFLIMSFLAI